jgi:squalene-associated FAD-dependent desaturase
LNDPEVIIIGGGFAGLAAATALAAAGRRVLVIEARPQLGGRAATHRDPYTGERIDNGQHVLAGCYDETLEFLRRIGSERALRRPATLKVAMLDRSGWRHELSLPPLSSPFHLLAGVLAWRDLSWNERFAILRVGRHLHRPDRAAAGETVRQWLGRHGQPARLCELFWEPLALATLNQSIGQASAASFLVVISRMLGGDASAATLLVPAVLLHDLYVTPSEAFLSAHRAAIRTGKPARIGFNGDRLATVVAGDETFTNPLTIAAVPWFAMKDLLVDPPPVLASLLDTAAALESSPIVTVNVWFDRPVIDDEFIGLPGRDFQWVFDKRRIIGGALSHLSLVSSGAADIVALDNHRLAERALADLRSAIPAVRSAAVRHVSIVRERRATFSLAPSMPPRPATRTPVSGLLLAGDWMDTGLPATIESAVVSGHRAATAALELLRH